MPNRGGQDPVPEGAQIGLGVRTTAIRNLHMQGALTQTGNQLDLALNGRGWFQVTGPNGETFYTRAGSFNKNATGPDRDRRRLSRAAGDDDPVDGDRGERQRDRPGVHPQRHGYDAAQIGQLSLANFTNEAGLEALGGNLYRETPASGTPVTGVPGDPGFGKVHQGYLENSNVDPVKEITELIQAQRSYEMNSKVIQASDEMYSTVSKNMR